MSCRASLCGVFLLAGTSAGAETVETLVEPDRVCATTLVMAIGVGTDRPPQYLIETVTRASTDRGNVWRSVHVPLDIGQSALSPDTPTGFDVTDVSASTLQPLSSIARWTPCPTAFEFDHDRGVATKLPACESPGETVDLGGNFIVPEGPGNAVFNQAIPWREGLEFDAMVIDRWRGSGQDRLKRLRVRVGEATSFAVGGREYPVWRVTKTAADGSFAIEELITRDRPHVMLRTAYRPAPEMAPIVSEVTAVMRGGDCESVLASTVPGN